LAIVFWVFDVELVRFHVERHQSPGEHGQCHLPDRAERR
jgi:hypothetical protein